MQTLYKYVKHHSSATSKPKNSLKFSLSLSYKSKLLLIMCLELEVVIYCFNL